MGEVLEAEVPVGVGKFFSNEEKEKIILGIQTAEKNTSGEIRVHLVKHLKGDILEEGKKIFEQLGMTKTAERNGILFLLSLKDHQFAILGDQGIHDKVHAEFWQTIRNELEGYFKQGLFSAGLVAGIVKCGEELKRYFPCQAGDKNELPDSISS